MNQPLETYEHEAPVEDLSLPVSESSRRPRRIAAFSLTAGVILLFTLSYFAVRGRPQTTAVNGFELVATTDGVVSQVLVQEGQLVEQGELLVAFDDTAEQHELNAAQQALQAMASQVKNTDVAVAVTPPEGVAGRIVPIGPLPRGPRPSMPSNQKLPVLPAPKGAPNSPLPAVEAAPTTPPTTTIDLEAGVRELETKIAETKNDILSTEHRLGTARTEAEDAQKNAEAAKVIADQRRQQMEKMKMLLSEGAVSQLETARAEVQYASAQGGYEVALRLADEARAKVQTLEDELAKQQKAVPELEKSLVANREMIKKVAAIKPTPMTNPATPAPPIRELDDRPSSLPKPAFVQAAPLPSTPTKVEVDKGAIREVDQQLAAARERVDKAEAALVARRFTSTRKGKVVRILVKPGEHVKAGQVVAIIQ